MTVGVIPRPLTGPEAPLEASIVRAPAALDVFPAPDRRADGLVEPPGPPEGRPRAVPAPDAPALARTA